jgi:hypothetical protein
MAGLNDIIRPRHDLDAALHQMDEMLRELRAIGSTVVTATFPDVSPINPVARLARKRLHYFNSGIKEIAARRNALLVDAEDFPLTDRRMWCDDRLHLSPEGHRGLASATARTLGLVDELALPTSLPIVVNRPYLERLRDELRWGRAYLVPWVRRRLTGRSSGDGRYAKRPLLQPVVQPSD